MAKKLLISALEPSANLHLGEILKELKDYEICGIFDEKFGSPYAKSSEFSAMGFFEILPLILKAKRALKALVKMARECDAVLLIDSPAFNIPLAKALKQAGISAKITYFILPQVWAWKPGRAKIVEENCDNLAAIWDFEHKFYPKCHYVGSPLLDEINFDEINRAQILARNLEQNKQNLTEKIAFLPGSRIGEIKRLMPIFRDLATKFEDKKLVLPIPANLMARKDEIYGDLRAFEISDDAVLAMSGAKFAFICSGTATMQAALIGTPFVLCYKAKPIDIFIARKFVKLKYAGLANIILDFLGEKPLNLELIQEQVTRENLLKAYENESKNVAKFDSVSKRLREYLAHGAAKNVANLIKFNQL